VLAQTRRVDEILIADDASTDGTRELVRALDSEYPQIQGIVREANVGVALNRDMAIRAATGDLITTLDGDDEYSHGKIEAEERVLCGRTTDIAFSDIDILYLVNGARRNLSLSSYAQLSKDERLKRTIRRRGPIPRDLLLSKELYLSSGGYHSDMKIYEDWELKIRLLHMESAWKYSGEVGTIYRVSGDGLSSAAESKHLQFQHKALRKNRRKIIRQLDGYQYGVAILGCYARYCRILAGRWVRLFRKSIE
jgi:glycosyltransferase involved in cell wall biosynthesis